jgi:hypothetical protein
MAYTKWNGNFWASRSTTFELRSITTSIDELDSLQLDARTLVIILKTEAMFIEGHQVVFVGCFQNTNESQMENRLSKDVSYRLWLQNPFNYLGSEQWVSYIAVIFCKILKKLYV